MLPHRSCIIAFLLCLCSARALHAQSLVAGFTTSQTGGCSPISTSFVNTTTGASKNATYTWNYGNTNQVTTPDSTYSSAATYVNPGNYTVTLTVTDGAKVSTNSQVITVYGNPTVAFTATPPASACAPETVNLTSTALAGSGTISSYYWDFGDGTTQQAADPSITHTYTAPGSPTIQLSVTNSFGCSATLAQPGLLRISAGIQPAFSTDSTSLCTLGDAASFVNTTTGPGTLSYLWKFGDGATATGISPAHTYTTPGIYSVTLLTTSTAGCSDTLQKPAYITVAEHQPVFKLPTSVCQGAQILLTDSSNPAPNPQSEIWTVSNNGSQYGANTSYWITQPGQYKVTLSAQYGTCVASLTQPLTVYANPTMGNFVTTFDSSCGVPAVYHFKDTSAAAVAWAWGVGIGPPVFATTPSASFTFTEDGEFEVGLTITDVHGCQANVVQPVLIQEPYANIAVNTISPNSFIACTAITAQLSASGNSTIVQYLWNFGDGTTSTEAMPTHTYSAVGIYPISLQFVTSAGCKGTAVSSNSIQVLAPPVVNFTISPANPVCGNDIVTVQATGGAYGYAWNFGDSTGSVLDEYASNQTHQYTKEGSYTITLIGVGYYAFCTDTVTKVNAVVITPSFPKILSAANTCSGSRGQVTFADSIRGATGITWNFGDGTSQTLSSPQDSLVHTYTKSGVYKVLLTTTAGNCTNDDSTTVYVLLKQHPLLTTPQSIVCADSSLSLSITNLDTNYWALANADVYNQSYLPAFQYGNGTFYASMPWSGGLTPSDGLSGTLNYLQPDNDSIRVILQSTLMNCADTSNYVAVKISGPVPGFEATGNSCYKDPVLFSDTSRPSFGGPIVKYVWTFGDGTGLTTTVGGPVSHTYEAPGTYYPQLHTTDSAGCTTATTDIGTVAVTGGITPVTVNGPQASFYWTPANILPGTTATFINSTTGPYNSTLWTFASDGSTSTNLYSVNHTYPNVTTDTVTLVVYGNTPGYCSTDTSVQVVPVRSVSASFTYTQSYVNGNNCPPVLLNFVSNTFNVTGWSWDFGDGSTSVGNPNPSHTYNRPGKYYIILTATGSGVSISTTDSVIVKGPYATISVNLPQSCAPATVTLSALAVNAVSYIWDFGDGTVINASDTFLTHTYLIPGVYNPTLILEDSLGCKASYTPGSPVVADSLSTQIGETTGHLCDSGQVSFSAAVYSLSATRLGEALTYHWTFGTGNPGDTANTPNPVFTYGATGPGTYLVHLTVTSAPGCQTQSTDSVVVTHSDPGTIAGPSAACAGDTLRFTASPAFATPGLQWTWVFAGNVLDTGVLSAPLVLSPGNYSINLISVLGGCGDTTAASVTVHPLPDIAPTPTASNICLGNSVPLLAHDGITYAWSPATGLDNPALAGPVANPTVSTTYTVLVTSVYGCVDSDSVLVSVSGPFKMQVPVDTFVCKGDSIQLDPAGAYTYQWINGIPPSDTANPAPWVSPSVNTTYTVAGFDKYDCFSDTASVTVAVEPLPAVQASPVGILPAGNSVTLTATGSPDIVGWTWSPTAGLSCISCAAPLSTPDSSMVYTVTGHTIYGCAASDTVRITLVCHENSVVVPTAFTPNGDGVNDIFYPTGKGARLISSFRIYGRWGNLVFERHNIALRDISNGWDGRLNGKDQPVGAYVYFVDVICDTGEGFTLKGTVMLER